MAPLILQSVVKQGADKLKRNGVAIDNATVRKTEEQYRILCTKVAPGKLHFDTAERRAAVLLWENTEDLSWKQVCDSIGVKHIKKLQQFHQLVKNYLAPQENTQRRSIRNQNQVIHYNSNTVSTVYEPKILPELVIRLSGFLLFPCGIQKETICLLESLYKDVPNNVSERRGHLYDLHRYQAAYEAAALYHVAKQSGCRIDPIIRLKKSMKDPADEGMDDEDEVEGEKSQTHATMSSQPLQLSDIVNLSNEYTYHEVKEKLPRIQELAAKLGKQPNPRPFKRARAETAPTRPKKLVQEETASNVAEMIVNFADTMVTDDNPHVDNESNFASHKQQVLDEACERYRISSDQGREALLALAADAILLNCKYDSEKSLTQ